MSAHTLGTRLLGSKRWWGCWEGGLVRLMRPAPHKPGKFEGRREWALHVFSDALVPSTCSVDAAECEQARRQGWVCATCKYLLQAICKLISRRVHKHICLPTNTLRRVAQMDRIRIRIMRAGERKKKSGRKGGYMSDSSDCVLGAQKLMGAFVGVRFSRDQGMVVLKCPESCARTKLAWEHGWRGAVPLSWVCDGGVGLARMRAASSRGSFRSAKLFSAQNKGERWARAGTRGSRPRLRSGTGMR